MSAEPGTYAPDMACFTLASHARPHRDRPAILLVEDEKFSRALLTTILGDNFEVHTAHNGMEALQLYEHLAPDVVFLDIDMPLLDGLTVLSYISSFDNECFIVMVTASDSENDKEAAATCGAKGYITKPFSRAMVDNYLEQFRTQRLIAH